MFYLSDFKSSEVDSFYGVRLGLILFFCFLPHEMSACTTA